MKRIEIKTMRPRAERARARRHGGSGAVLSFALAFLLSSSAALAAEQTRETYKAEAEPICKADKAASDRYLKGVKGLVKDDRLAKASRNFAKAAAALERAQKQLAAVPQPPADSARLGNWLGGIKGEVALMRRISAKLAKGQKGPASSLSVRLQHNATATNNLVIAFQFNYCKIEPSQYT
jgi:hypothetical protein